MKWKERMQNNYDNNKNNKTNNIYKVIDLGGEKLSAEPKTIENNAIRKCFAEKNTSWIHKQIKKSEYSIQAMRNVITQCYEKYGKFRFGKNVVN